MNMPNLEFIYIKEGNSQLAGSISVMALIYENF